MIGSPARSRLARSCLGSLLLGLLGLPGLAQGGSLGLGLTGLDLAQRDLQVSPLIYQGLNGGLSLDGRQGGADWRFEQELTAWYGGLHAAGVGPRSFSVVQERPISGEDEVVEVREQTAALSGRARLEARRALGPAGLDLGLRLESDALNGWSVAFGHWAWFNAELGPAAAWFVPLRAEALSLQLRLALPVVAVVTRFPEDLNPILPDTSQVAGFFQTGTRLASLGSHQRVSLGAELVLGKDTARWQWVAGLRADWLHDSVPEPLYRLAVGLCLGGRFNLGRTP